MNLENLFSTKERIRILETVLFQTGRLSVNQVAAVLKLSKGLVSKYLDILVREGVAKKSGMKFVVDHAAPLVKGSKLFLNLCRIDTRLFQKYPFVKAVGLYGSCARGENLEDSDVDLWIRVSETNADEEARLAAGLRKRIKNVRPILLSPEKIKRLKKEDELFYHSLSFGSIHLYGLQNALEL